MNKMASQIDETTLEENKQTTTFTIEEEGSNHQYKPETWSDNIKYLLVGVFFGVVFVKAEIISWFRIQEMFHLHAFHMYGVIGTAVVVGILSVQIIQYFNIKTLQGEKVILNQQQFHWGQVWGGLLFGFGWVLTGACPGPLFAQIGSGFGVVIVTLLSALAGTWAYGYLQAKLPH